MGPSPSSSSEPGDSCEDAKRSHVNAYTGRVGWVGRGRRSGGGGVQRLELNYLEEEPGGEKTVFYSVDNVLQRQERLRFKRGASDHPCSAPPTTHAPPLNCFITAVLFRSVCDRLQRKMERTEDSSRLAFSPSWCFRSCTICRHPLLLSL